MIFENFFYLFALLFSISGLLIIDYRYKLAFWHSPRRSALTILIAMLIFIVWDGIGIITGIFFKGNSSYMLPFVIAPEFPIEELFFLFLLTYVTLILHRGIGQWQHTS